MHNKATLNWLHANGGIDVVYKNVDTDYNSGTSLSTFGNIGVKASSNRDCDEQHKNDNNDSNNNKLPSLLESVAGPSDQYQQQQQQHQYQTNSNVAVAIASLSTITVKANDDTNTTTKDNVVMKQKKGKKDSKSPSSSSSSSLLSPNAVVTTTTNDKVVMIKKKKKKDSNDNNDKWDEKYQILVDFHQLNGHSSVLRSDENKKLAGWVKRQRNKKREGKLDQDKIDLLEKMQFCWHQFDHAWETKYKMLRDHYKQQGDCKIPTSNRLVEWINRQKRGYSQGRESMTETRIFLLENLSHWTW